MVGNKPRGELLMKNAAQNLNKVFRQNEQLSQKNKKKCILAYSFFFKYCEIIMV
jgi:hypothetical protein